jgi:hypothetical protein
MTSWFCGWFSLHVLTCACVYIKYKTHTQCLNAIIHTQRFSFSRSCVQREKIQINMHANMNISNTHIQTKHTHAQVLLPEIVRSVRANQDKSVEIEDTRIATQMEIDRQRLPGGMLRLFPPVDVVIEDSGGQGQALLIKPKMAPGMGRGLRSPVPNRGE